MAVETLPENLFIDLHDHSSNFSELHFLRSPVNLDLSDGHKLVAGQMILVVLFKSGAHYAYAGVTSPLIDACMKGSKQLGLAEGKETFGQALHQEIIGRKDLYPYVRLNESVAASIIGE